MTTDRFQRDLEMFGNGSAPVVQERATPTDMETAAKKGAVVLGMLRDAGLKLPFQMDTDSAKNLWGAELSRYPTELLVEAVREWAGNPDNGFPSVGEFASMCGLLERSHLREAAIARGLGSRIPGQVCPECEDTGFTYLYEPGGDSSAGVTPCPTCRKERHRAHQDGCDVASHVAYGGCDRCNPKGKRR